jgi:hypothetical protein
MDWANLDNFNRLKTEPKDANWYLHIRVEKGDEGWINPKLRGNDKTLRNPTDEQVRKAWGEEKYQNIGRKFHSWGVMNHSRDISFAEMMPLAMKGALANVLADPKKTQEEKDNFLEVLNQKRTDTRLFDGVRGDITLEDALKMKNAGVLKITIYYKE